MSQETEARRDIAAYMARDLVAYVGPVEAVYNAMFGPFQADAHVKCRKAHIEAGSLADRLRAADAAVRAECARMSAEFNAKFARNNPSLSIAAE